MSDEFKILKNIYAELQKLNFNNRLWDKEALTYYFDVSLSTVNTKIITDSSFPRAISVNGTNPRWVPDEVKKWALQKRV